jgi:hypothetical protein
MGKKLSEMTFAERTAVIKRAAARFQDELQASAPEIARILFEDASDEPATTGQAAYDEALAQLAEQAGTASTPVADALQAVDANRAELLRVQGEFGETDTSSERDAYLGALENLADAVRSHGIGAELGQLREARQPVPARVHGNTCLTCGETFRGDVLGPHIQRVHGGQLES